jgi:hypothetical protein
MSRDNGMEESIDSGQCSSVGPHIIPNLDPVSPDRPSYSPLPKSMYLVPLLLYHSLKIGGGLRGTHRPGSRYLRVTRSFISSCSSASFHSLSYGP